MSINLNNFSFTLIVAAIVLLAVAFAIYKAIRPWIHKSPEPPPFLPDAIPPGGYDVPLLDAYGSIKDVDRSSVTQNLQKPRLTLFADHLEYKLIFRRSAKYSDILEASTSSQLDIDHLTLTFTHQNLVLTVLIGSHELFRQIVDFLKAKGVIVIEE